MHFMKSVGTAFHWHVSLLLTRVLHVQWDLWACQNLLFPLLLNLSGRGEKGGEANILGAHPGLWSFTTVGFVFLLFSYNKGPSSCKLNPSVSVHRLMRSTWVTQNNNMNIVTLKYHNKTRCPSQLTTMHSYKLQEPMQDLPEMYFGDCSSRFVTMSSQKHHLDVPSMDYIYRQSLKEEETTT